MFLVGHRTVQSMVKGEGEKLLDVKRIAEISGWSSPWLGREDLKPH